MRILPRAYRGRASGKRARDWTRSGSRVGNRRRAGIAVIAAILVPLLTAPAIFTPPPFCERGDPFLGRVLYEHPTAPAVYPDISCRLGSVGKWTPSGVVYCT